MKNRFYHLTRPRGVGYAVDGFSRACLIRLIDFPEMPLRTNVQETIKAGGTALLVRTEFPFEQERIPVAYKRVRRRNWWKVLTGLFRTNRLLKTWRLGQSLLDAEIRTPRPLAVVVPHWYQIGTEAYLAVEWVEGAQNLLQLADDLERLSARLRAKTIRSTVIEIGRLIARMHEARISHRDLKASNLLLECGNQSVRSYVIDLDGARQHRWRLSWYVRWSNLSRLVRSSREMTFVSHTDRLRLLKVYLDASSDPKPDWKTAWRQLEIITDSRALRHRKRAA